MPTSSTSTRVYHRTLHAMATTFEAWLVGDDDLHLEAVANACCDEIARIESLLSKFEPASEVARINREAAQQPVKVDVECFALLERCQSYHRETQGAFDIAYTGGGSFNDVALDSTQRTIAFRNSDLKLDMGGIGKGYALDRCAEILQRFHINSALLHGGTSSVLALGHGRNGKGWRVGIRNPSHTGEGAADEILSLTLADQHLSTSATGAQHDSPATSCTVIAASGEEAEVFSTALLAMGRAEANDVLQGRPDLRVLWVDAAHDGINLQWLSEPMT